MTRIINFVAPGVSIDPHIQLNSPYGYVVQNILKPITKYLPHFAINPKPLTFAVNVHFFFRVSSMPGSISVFIQHGLADKELLSANKVKDFDFVCVSGPVWINKLVSQGMREQQLIIIGYPPLDPAFNKGREINSNSRKTILYAPTHSNSPPTTFPKFLDYLGCFPDRYNFVVSEHPYDRSERTPSLSRLMDADVVITDCGSIIYEAWSMGKAVIFPDWLCQEKVIKQWPNSYEAYIYEKQLGYHAVDCNHLLELIELALEKGMGEPEKAFIEGIFPRELRGFSGQTAAQALEKLAGM